MSLFTFWFATSLVAWILTGIMLYQKSGVFYNRGAVLWWFLLTLIPIFNFAMILAGCFNVFEKSLKKFEKWLDAPVYKTTDKDW